MGEAVSPLCAVSATTVTTFLSQCCMPLLLLFKNILYFSILIFIHFLVTTCRTWDLSSLTRDRIHALYIGILCRILCRIIWNLKHGILTTGPHQGSPYLLLFFNWTQSLLWDDILRIYPWGNNTFFHYEIFPLKMRRKISCLSEENY